MEVLTTYSLKYVYSIFLSIVIIYSVFLNILLNTGPPISNLLQQHIWNLLLFRWKRQVSKQLVTPRHVLACPPCLPAHTNGTSSGFSCILWWQKHNPALTGSAGWLQGSDPPQARMAPESRLRQRQKLLDPQEPSLSLPTRTTPVLSRQLEPVSPSPPADKAMRKHRRRRACLETDDGKAWPSSLADQDPGQLLQDMRASVPGPHERKGVHAEGETRARRPRLPQNLLSAECSRLLCPHSPFLLLRDSAFLRTNPFLPARPLYWHRAACGSLLWSLYLRVSCNLLVSFPVLLIWALLFFPRWVWLKVYFQFCFIFSKKQLVVSGSSLPVFLASIGPRILVPLVFIFHCFTQQRSCASARQLACSELESICYVASECCWCC